MCELLQLFYYDGHGGEEMLALSLVYKFEGDPDKLVFVLLLQTLCSLLYKCLISYTKRSTPLVTDFFKLTWTIILRFQSNYLPFSHMCPGVHHSDRGH